jgi:hypothetical protein
MSSQLEIIYANDYKAEIIAWVSFQAYPILFGIVLLVIVKWSTQVNSL